MNGELKIIVTEKNIQVVGFLKESSLIDRVTVVDALMNAFEMKGEKRKLVCDMLLSVDEVKSKLSDGEIEDLFEKLLRKVKTE